MRNISILNLDKWHRRRYYLKIFLIYSSGIHFCLVEWDHLCNFGRWHNEKDFCEIILNLDKWFRRRCRLKIFLSSALVAILFDGVGPFV